MMYSRHKKLINCRMAQNLLTSTSEPERLINMFRRIWIISSMQCTTIIWRVLKIMKIMKSITISLLVESASVAVMK